ncbi:MAG: hypothetical protein ACP5O1_01795 [Phycisphaerae bacterium]
MNQPPEFHICRNRRDDHVPADDRPSPSIVAVVISVCRGTTKPITHR